MYAAVRVRGVPDARKKASETMETLHLHNKHNCMLLPEDDTFRGMLQQVKDYVAYGPVTEETVAAVLERRGRIDGTPLPDAVTELDYDDAADMAAALMDGEVTPFTLRSKGLELPFRLSPPSKGFKDSKRHAGQGGSVGKREDMDALLGRMI